MSKTSNIITPSTKAQILAELEVPGYVVSKLAKAYKVSTTSIYNLKRAAQETSPVGEFIELSVKHPPAALQKASLIFDNFSLVLEGKLQSASLLSIIKILEEQSC